MTDQLFPAYSPVYVSLPAPTQGALQVVTRHACQRNSVNVEEQIFQALFIDVFLVCCQSNSFEVGDAFDINTKLKKVLKHV